MKIVSWNVNGLTACLKKDFISSIMKIKADIICLQETKLNEPIEMDLPYHFYWHCAKKKGYSGTLIMSRYNPLSIRYGIGNEKIDDEGRVITVEYKHYYLVNVYVPNSQGKLHRVDFRNKFDIEFTAYIDELQKTKPVVVCGDFNVAYKDIDIYPEHEINEVLTNGFETQERDNFTRLLETGMVDPYRVKNPDKIEYSWWSNRFNKRFTNQGWRIDYFLVTENLNKYVLRTEYLNDVYGSDHCPVLMEINNRHIGVDKFTDEELAQMWEKIDWVKAEDELLKMQQRLTKASFAGNLERVEHLRTRIVRSDFSKMLAVRHATHNDPSPGIDNVRWRTPAEKMRASMLLSSKDYKAQPCKYVLLSTKNNIKERKIGIPTIYDRAMQVLYAFALDPIAEAQGERKSFAFRKGRALQDAHEFIIKCLSMDNAPTYVLKTDVKSYYDTISHKWLVDNIPMDKYVLNEFLKSGYIFAGSLFPTEEGISLGANISPILGNMVLDGLQKYIYDKLYKGGEVDFDNGNIIRFADDILVMVRSQEDANKVKGIITDFLFPRGLRLSEEKTTVHHVDDGFEFLSRHYIRKQSVIYSTPSKAAVTKFETSLRDLIEDYKGSQQSLIEAINKKLNGFATYHKITEAKEAFRHIDVTVDALLLNLCQKKHPKQAKKKLISKYWYKTENGRYIYALPSKTECQVIKLSQVILTNHRRVKTSANPYLDSDYFEEREKERAMQNVTGLYKGVWAKQQGKCYYCGKEILADQPRTVVQIDPTKQATMKNLAFIHLCCKESEMVHINAEQLCDELTQNGVIDLLETLHKDEKVKVEHRPFEYLREFFLNLEQSPYTMKFEDMEKIMDAPLCASAYKHSAYWYNKKSGCISNCWTKNGYIIQNLHLDKKYIVFRKEDTNISKVKIPKVFLTEKIPLDAKYEVENYLEHIRKKYAL